MKKGKVKKTSGEQDEENDEEKKWKRLRRR